MLLGYQILVKYMLYEKICEFFSQLETRGHQVPPGGISDCDAYHPKCAWNDHKIEAI